MDAKTFVEGLLPLRGEAVARYIAQNAAQVDDLNAAAKLLKAEAEGQDYRDLAYAEIIASHLLALAHWTSERRHFALAWLAFGNVRLLQGHHHEAIRYLDDAGTQFLASGDEIGWARTRISYLWSASQVGHAAQALEQAERAREVFLAHHEEQRAGNLDIAIALALEEMGRYQESLVAFDRALLTYQPSDPKQAALHRAKVLVNKGAVFEVLGELPKAVACEQEARAIFTRHEEFQRAAMIDQNLAYAAASQGRYSAALHLYYQALEQYQLQTGLHNWEALCKSNIAECLLQLNRAPEALRLAQEAVAIYHTLDEIQNYAWALIRLARAQTACGEPERALDTLAEARQRFESIGAIATSGLVLLTLAELQLSLNQVTQAHATVEQAQAVFRHYAMKKWLIEADLLTGRIYEATGSLTLAKQLTEQALKEARESGFPWLEFGCQSLLGRLAQRQGEPVQAERHYQAALTLLEGLMIWLVRDQRSTFLSDKEDIFSALISLALQRQDTNMSLEYLERLRSQVLREYLTRSEEIRLKTSDPDEMLLLEELQRLRQELQGYAAQAATLERHLQETDPPEQELAMRGGVGVSSVPTTPQEHLLERLRTQQHQCEQKINQVLERAFLQHESVRFAVLPSPGAHTQGTALSRPALVERLGEVLPPATTLIEYFLHGDDLLIFTLHPKQQAGVQTVSGGARLLTQQLLPLFRASIHMAGQQLLAQPVPVGLLSALQANIQGRSRQLYNLLLKPVEEHLPHDGRVLIVPYGPLHLLPFHALLGAERYLIEQCEVAYLPAASMLTLQAAPASGIRPNRRGKRQSLVFGHSYDGKLQHIIREAQAVAALLDTSPYLEKEATIKRLQQAHGAHTIIHLAAHGKNRSEAPDYSYLKLADGQLSMVDVFNLDLPAELVTLSGCETGLVVIGGGDELLGLGRGFLYAGARSLLISLWSVEDASTATLMEHFYRGLLAGQSRAGALRAAQLTLLARARTEPEQAAWAHPYFWAPFRLMGEAGPISL